MPETALRFGVAGLGVAGAGILQSMARHPQVKIVAAADLRPEPRARFVSEYGATGHVTIEDLCADPQVDAVYLATPTPMHPEHTELALAAGKHVICEKPMALTLEAADRIIAAADRASGHLLVGHSHSYDPPIVKIRELVTSGRLGNLRMLHNWYYNDWIYRPRLRDELDSSLGGGVTFRQGSHQFDIIRYIAGGMVRSVRAMTAAWDPARPAEGAHTVYLEFENGVAATAVYSGYDHFHSTELTHITEGGTEWPADAPHARARKALPTGGSEETLKRDGGYGGARSRRSSDEEPHQSFYGLTIVTCEHGDIRQSPDGLLVYGDSDREEVPLPKGVTGRDLMLSELCDAVFAGKPVRHGARWGKANLEVCLAAIESSRDRTEVFLKHQVPTPE